MPQLREYQLDVIERSRARIADGARRLIIQSPTGAGKTHISSEIIRRACERGVPCLFLAHRRRLIEQKTARLSEFGVPHGVIMRGVQRTSSLVQVASRDTLLSRAVRNEWMELPPAKLVVVDECHNCMADEFQGLLERYRDAVVIGMTATPARSDGKGLGNYFQGMECTVPTSQLISEGYLVPVKCYAPEEADGKGLCGDPVTHWRKWADGRPTVLFAAKVMHSRAAAAAFTAAGVPARHIDAHTSDEERDEVIDGLKSGGVQVVCNVGIWTEGVDVPCLSCCILLRGCESAVLYYQAVGRVMRPDGVKSHSVLIDHAGAVYRFSFPDEDVPWSLDTGDSVEKRLGQEKEAGKKREPILCPKCFHLYSGGLTCPECGHQIKRKDKPARKEDGLLIEVGRDIQEYQSHDEQVRYWHRCLGVMCHKGNTVSAAGMMFKQRFGFWPPQDMPNFPRGKSEWHRKVRDLYPQYMRG